MSCLPKPFTVVLKIVIIIFGLKKSRIHIDENDNVNVIGSDNLKMHTIN